MKKKLEKILGIKIKDENLFIEAFTHKSYLNENRNIKSRCNERMEFLGDAILEYLTTNFLFFKYPEKEEGKLTVYRSALVKGENLAQIAKKLNLGDFLFLSKGEEKSGGKEKNYILANTFEAVLGAIFLDSGIEVAKKVLDKFLFPDIDKILEKNLYKDSKSLFQEIAQEKENTTPKFKVLAELGPDHEKIFHVGAFLNNKLIGTGKDSSKQKASLKAAKDALKNLNWE